MTLATWASRLDHRVYLCVDRPHDRPEDLAQTFTLLAEFEDYCHNLSGRIGDSAYFNIEALRMRSPLEIILACTAGAPVVLTLALTARDWNIDRRKKQLEVQKLDRSIQEALPGSPNRSDALELKRRMSDELSLDLEIVRKRYEISLWESLAVERPLFSPERAERLVRNMLSLQLLSAREVASADLNRVGFNGADAPPGEKE